MTRLEWWKPEEKLVQGGLDRGVLYPQGRAAVPWNGLTNVNEDGGQESTSYYIDGRKFVTIVTPREYKASLSAFTFPDEFAEICGIIEAADGLFLDSQVPDQFGLCYRTLYGDNGHYKLHLVYQATASMSNVQYQSLSSDSNDPTPFEFDIEAIPQTIAGFRPTAHVILDSRHIDPHLLANLENKLYGTYGQDPYLPDIQSLFDLMNYGEGVVISDNGDGSWSAEGSYKYVSVDQSSGLMRVDNVTVTDHGDGTFDVSDAAV